MKIQQYNDFVTALMQSGFSMGGENDEGIYGLSAYFGESIAWHSGHSDTDPWEWRMRVLEERSDVAYSKLFFKKSGFITQQWYPYFLSVRRKGYHFHEAVRAGFIGQQEKKIYELIAETGALPVHEIKKRLQVTKESAGAFDKALVALQMAMYITTCGRRQKTNWMGESFGWSSTVFCTVEQFWGDDLIENALAIPVEEAAFKISQQVAKLNPDYDVKKLRQFIYG